MRNPATNVQLNHALVCDSFLDLSPDCGLRGSHYPSCGTEERPNRAHLSLARLQLFRNSGYTKYQKTTYMVSIEQSFND